MCVCVRSVCNSTKERPRPGSPKAGTGLPVASKAVGKPRLRPSGEVKSSVAPTFVLELLLHMHGTYSALKIDNVESDVMDGLQCVGLHALFGPL